MISPEVMKELLSVRQVLHYLPVSPSTERGWTPQESQLFWMALVQYPQGPWTVIAEFIGTKSTRQAMTHGQKLRQKLKRWNKRLRRNPVVGSLMDEVSVSPDGRISLGSSPITTEHPFCVQQGDLSIVKMQSSPDIVMKQEELRTDGVSYTNNSNSCSLPGTFESYDGLHDPNSVGFTTDTSARAYLTSMTPADASLALPSSYSSLSGFRPYLLTPNNLAYRVSFEMNATASWSDATDEVSGNQSIVSEQK